MSKYHVVTDHEYVYHEFVQSRFVEHLYFSLVNFKKLILSFPENACSNVVHTFYCIQDVESTFMLTTLVQVVVVGLLNLIFSATLHSINQFVYFRQLGP